MAKPIAAEMVEHRLASEIVTVADSPTTASSDIAADTRGWRAGHGPTPCAAGPASRAVSDIFDVQTVHHNPAAGEPGADRDRQDVRVPANRGRRFPPEVLTPAEVQALLDACSLNPLTELRNRAFLTTLYRTGLRCSEALALDPKDIDFLNTSVRVLHGKGDRSRTVGIDPAGLDIIRRWMTERDRRGFTATQPLFCTRNGKSISSSYVREFIKKLGTRAGIAKRVHAHGLRHTHAYELMMEGIPVSIIQRQLGHSSLATTDTYLSHIAPQQVIDAIAGREWLTRTYAMPLHMNSALQSII